MYKPAAHSSRDQPPTITIFGETYHDNNSTDIWRISMSIAISFSLFFRYPSLTCFANFPVFLAPWLQYWAIFLRPAQYLVSLLHSLSFPRSFLLFRLGRRYFYIPFEMSCGCIPCYGIDIAVSLLCCFSHIRIFLRSHKTDTLLL